jgi:hypothetical protein
MKGYKGIHIYLKHGIFIHNMPSNVPEEFIENNQAGLNPAWLIYPKSPNPIVK